MEKERRLPEHAVYSDVVNGGHILPKKEKYTMADFKKLIKVGWNQLDARWIILCSATHYKTDTSAIFYTEKFLFNCELGIALL